MAPKTPLQRIEIVEKKFGTILHGDDEDEVKPQCHKKLAEVCKIVRAAMSTRESNLDEIIERAEASLDRMIMNASAAENETFDFIESFAHATEDDLIKDPDPTGHTPGGLLENFLSFLSRRGSDNPLAAQLGEHCSYLIDIIKGLSIQII